MQGLNEGPGGLSFLANLATTIVVSCVLGDGRIFAIFLSFYILTIVAMVVGRESARPRPEASNPRRRAQVALSSPGCALSRALPLTTRRRVLLALQS